MHHSIKKSDVELFRAAYEKCEDETFMFGGVEFLKSYAKYLLEYWDMQLKVQRQEKHSK